MAAVDSKTQSSVWFADQNEVHIEEGGIFQNVNVDINELELLSDPPALHTNEAKFYWS